MLLRIVLLFALLGCSNASAEGLKVAQVEMGAVSSVHGLSEKGLASFEKVIIIQYFLSEKNQKKDKQDTGKKKEKERGQKNRKKNSKKQRTKVT